MEQFDQKLLKKLYIPHPSSHKGQNGKLMIIGGSQLFHAASIWALTVASRVVDMVFYSSAEENNKIVHELKKEFRNGIVVRREDIENYIEEADAVLIGPGMVRTDKSKIKNQISKIQIKNQKLTEINSLEDEGLQSYYLTKYLLEKYPKKKWIIDAGALQMMEPEWLLPLNGNVILTPHPQEFKRVFESVQDDNVSKMAKKYNCTILLKGERDIVCSPKECVEIAGGNAGMTKGGTGDVLAGLVAALATKNELFLSAQAGSYINKKAGDELFEQVGFYFNASDLANKIPEAMKKMVF